MTILPVGEWAPDSPDLSEYTTIALNVIPLTPESYGPFYAPVNYSSNSIIGASGTGFARDSAGNQHFFAGEAFGVQVISTGGSAFVNSGPSSPTTPTTGESWYFGQFGDLMIGTFWGNPVLSYDMTGSQFFAPLTAGTPGTGQMLAPQARYLAVAKTFLILANTYDPVGGYNPARLWWSPSGAPAGVTATGGGGTAWPSPGTAVAQQTQSDYSDELGPQGEIVGLAPNLSGCDCAVFFEHGVFNMFYAGPPTIFNFYPAANVRGCIAPNSITQLGGTVYYLGEDGFYAYDGNQSIPLGTNKVNNWFFDIVDLSHANLIVGAADVQQRAIVWAFKSTYAPSTNSDTLLIYRWDIQRWSYVSLSVAWLSRSIATVASASTGLVEGQLQLAAITTTGYLAFFTGTPLSAQVGTKVVQITPGARTFVNHTRPLVNSAAGSVPILTESGNPILTEQGFPILTEANGAVITVAMSARVNYYDTEVFGSDVAPNVMGDCPQRSDGRYHRARVSVPSGYWTEMFGVDVEGLKAGRR